MHNPVGHRGRGVGGSWKPINCQAFTTKRRMRSVRWATRDWLLLKAKLATSVVLSNAMVYTLGPARARNKVVRRRGGGAKPLTPTNRVTTKV